MKNKNKYTAEFEIEKGARHPQDCIVSPHLFVTLSYGIRVRGTSISNLYADHDTEHMKQLNTLLRMSTLRFGIGRSM